MKLLRPETRENVEEETENETRSFYTPTRSVRISSTQNDQNVSRNTQLFGNLLLLVLWKFIGVHASSIWRLLKRWSEYLAKLDS